MYKTIRLIPRKYEMALNLLKAAALVLLFFMFHFVMVRAFPYLVKGFRSWAECNCNANMANAFHFNSKKVAEHILSAIDQFDEYLFAIILVLLIISSILKTRIHYIKDDVQTESVEFDEGWFILRLLPRKRE